MVSSRQIYAFYLGLPVPPLLSVTSFKRFTAGGVSAETIVRQIHEYRARIVIMSEHWPPLVRDQVRREIAADYEAVYRDPGSHLLEVYLRKTEP